MLGVPNIDYIQAAKIASEGSPILLQAIGRAFGLGQDEREYLLKDGIPTWTWTMLALGAGFVIGVRVYRKWPNSIPKIVRGK